MKNNIKVKKKGTASSSAVALPDSSADFTLCLSNEMDTWLHETLHGTDQDGYLPETVASVLSQPLDAFSAFCPTGAIVSSQFASSKLPSLRIADKEDETLGPETTTNSALSNALTRGAESAEKTDTKKSTSSFFAGITGSLFSNATKSRPQNGPDIKDAVDRLNVLWLQRRAGFEKEEGDLDQAVNTLEEAIQLHLGTDDLSKARLADPLPTSNASELLGVIEKNYFLYDVKAHALASRLQRFYHRHYLFRCKAATTVSKYFRGFLVRNPLSQWKERRRQCAVMIQRRFRIHLIRMHLLATKIKRWYKMRVQMREFMRRRNIYRMARRIQRLFRGNQGRKIANQKRLELNMTKKIQRNARGLMSRRERSFGVMLFHRMFFLAARKIQTVARRIQGVRKAQLQLLKEIAREEDRYKRERLIVAETIRLEIARTKLYLQTDAGKLHYRDTHKRIKLKDDRFTANSEKMTDEEVLAQEAMISFELFDADGSGSIDIDELGGMMKELCIPLSKRSLSMLATDMDRDGSGDIDFNEFLDWYCHGGALSTMATGDLKDIMLMRMLRTRHAIMEASGLILHKRTERDVLRQCTSWLSKDVTTSFRIAHPPKYQCCQCLQPFVMFTDYYAHFDNEGNCGVLKIKAQYFKDFWVQKDWTYQRQLEYEIIRNNGESPHVNYHVMKEAYSELALQNDFEVRKLMRKYVRQCQYIFREKITKQAAVPGKSGKIGKIPPLGKQVVQIVDFYNDKKPSSFVVKVIAKHLGKRVPDDWVVDDKWKNEDVSKFILNAVDKQKALTRFSIVLTKAGRVRRDARILARIYVKTLRILKAEAESALVSLMEYRTKRVRKITIPDKDLKKLGLQHLNTRSYNEINIRIALRLKQIEDAFKAIFLVPLPRFCSFRKKIADPQIGTSGELSRDYLMKLLFEDAHVRANAKFRSRMRTLIGRTQIRRLHNELWAHQRLLTDHYHKHYVGIGISYLRYLYDRYTSMNSDSGIERQDINDALFEKGMLIRDKYMEEAMAQLDPNNTGYITFHHLRKWYKVACKSWKSYGFLASLYSVLVHSFIKIVHLQYSMDSRQVVKSDMKKLLRLELQYRQVSVRTLLFEAEQLNITTQALIAESEKGKNKSSDDSKSSKSTKSKKGTSTKSKKANSDDEKSKSAKSTAKTAKDDKSKVESSKATSESPDAVTEVAVTKDAEAPTSTAGNAVDGTNAPSSGATSGEAGEAGDGVEEALVKSEPLPEGYDVEADRALRKQLEVRLHDLVSRDKRAEVRLLVRITEMEATRKCFQEMRSRKGIEKLVYERRLIKASNEIITTLGFLLPKRVKYPWTIHMFRAYQRFIDSTERVSRLGFRAMLPDNFLVSDETEDVSYVCRDPEVDDDEFSGDFAVGWALALGVLVQLFDTDCSGTFDEGEVALLLRCVNCPLSERMLLYRFPEVKEGSARLETIVEYLATRVWFQRGLLMRLGWGGSLFIRKKNSALTSILMLLSLRGQVARQQAEQAATLAETGKFLHEDDDKSVHSLMMRSQMFAMRQQKLFQKTTFGRIKLREAKALIKQLWNLHAVSSHYSLDGIISFVYFLFQEKIAVLITELPFVVRYMMETLGFQANNDGLDALGHILYAVKKVDRVRWIHEDEFNHLMKMVFSPAINPCGSHRYVKKTHYVARRSAGRDAKVRLMSLARQQAVLISMKFEGIRVAETNYRCSILGLYEVIYEKSKSASWGILRSKPRYRIDWKRAPREAMNLLMMSRGYKPEDMKIGDIRNYASVEHANGTIVASQVSIREAFEVVKKETFDNFGILDHFSRFFRWFGGIPRYIEYFRVAKAIKLYPDEINLAGAAYLREIISGVSKIADDDV